MNGPFSLPHEISMSNKLISAKKHMPVYNPLMHKLFTIICIHTSALAPRFGITLQNSLASSVIPSQLRVYESR